MKNNHFIRNCYVRRSINHPEVNDGFIQDREEVIVPGTIVRHFKRDLVDIYPNNPFQYLYEVIGEAEHTETGEELIVYQALYGGRKMYCRPKAMFLSKVDKRKYPDAKQTYRLEVARFDCDTGRYY